MNTYLKIGLIGLGIFLAWQLLPIIPTKRWKTGLLNPHQNMF